MWYNLPDDYSFVPQGWICPKCGRVMAPNQPTCIYCNASYHNYINTIDDSEWWKNYLKESITAPKSDDWSVIHLVDYENMPRY